MKPLWPLEVLPHEYLVEAVRHRLGATTPPFALLALQDPDTDQGRS